MKNNIINTEQLSKIQELIHNNSEHIQLVAVTKFVDATTTQQLYDLGLTHFGENRSQALLEKLEALSHLRDKICWHFIGNLQTRQVKAIINEIDYLHSLDRLSLAKEIQKRSDKILPCFLQVNVSGEDSKSGVQPEEVEETIRQLGQYDKISVIGLMTMAPIDASEAELHQYFSHLRQIRDHIQAQAYPHAPCTELSMGMSRDYEIAIQEGATHLRIGTILYQ